MKNCCHLGRSVRDKPKSALPCSSPPVMARRRTPPSPRRTKQGSGQWRPGARASSYGVRARNKEGIGSGVLGGQGSRNRTATATSSRQDMQIGDGDTMLLLLVQVLGRGLAWHLLGQQPAIEFKSCPICHRVCCTTRRGHVFPRVS